MAFQRQMIAEVWNLAKTEEIGLAIPTDDLLGLQKELYATRALLGDPILAGFRVCLPEGGKEVWIVRQTVELD